MQVYGYQGLASGEQSEQLLAGFIRRAGSSHGKQGAPLVVGTKYFTGEPGGPLITRLCSLAHIQSEPAGQLGQPCLTYRGSHHEDPIAALITAPVGNSISCCRTLR